MSLFLPGVELTGDGLFVDGLEAVPNLTVELRVFGEPDLSELPVALLTLPSEPEGEDLLRRCSLLCTAHDGHIFVDAADRRLTFEV